MKNLDFPIGADKAVLSSRLVRDYCIVLDWSVESPTGTPRSVLPSFVDGHHLIPRPSVAPPCTHTTSSVVACHRTRSAASDILHCIFWSVRWHIKKRRGGKQRRMWVGKIGDGRISLPQRVQLSPTTQCYTFEFYQMADAGPGISERREHHGGGTPAGGHPQGEA